MRRRYAVDGHSPLVLCACALMAAGFCARLVWFLTLPAFDLYTLLVLTALPLLCSALYAVLLPLCGRNALWTTSIPVLLGCVFFALKATGFTPLHRWLCLLLYLAVAALYALTVFGVLPTQRLLLPLFGLPLLYHLLIEDRRTLLCADPPLTLLEWLPELSVLCIMAALFCASCAMRRVRK